MDLFDSDRRATLRKLVLGMSGNALVHVPALAHAPHDLYRSSRRRTGTTDAFKYSYVDYWSPAQLLRREKFRYQPFGTKPSLVQDIEKAEAIVAAAPKDSPISIAKYFSELTETGSTGEKFNARWKLYENPVIVWFFHATNLKPTGDCTSWCAAFVSWTLERAGHKSRHSASSQAYAEFGMTASNPKPGDVVVFQNVKDKGHGHVAFFLEQSTDQVKIIGGNRGNAGAIPSCPPGYPISSIGEDWRDRKNGVQDLRVIRSYF